MVRHPRGALLGPSRTFLSDGAPFPFQIGQFVPPRACLGLFGHSRDSCGFVSRRNGPPPKSGTFGTFTYLPVRWRAIPFPKKSAKASSSHQELVWAFLGTLGTRADSCHDGMVRHSRVALLGPSRTVPSDGMPFPFQINQQRPVRPTKSLFGPFWALSEL